MAQQVFSVPGSYTFTVPIGCTLFDSVIVTGGGGGGGTGDGIGDGGGGGGGGGCATGLAAAVTPGVMLSLTVGNGGAPDNGGNQSLIGIPAFAVLIGGAGGSGQSNSSGTGGSGGPASGGPAANNVGGDGGGGGSGLGGGGGGGAGGDSGVGSGGGAGVPFGSGTGGAGGATAGGSGGAGADLAGGNAVPGTAPGGGGGGGASAGGGLPSTAADGSIVLTWTWPTPTPTSCSPPSGPVAGGTAVTITGTGFSAGCVVSIGGSPATSVVVVSDTQITCVTPSGFVGLSSIIVTNTDGGSGGPQFIYTYTDSTTAGTAVGIAIASGVGEAVVHTHGIAVGDSSAPGRGAWGVQTRGVATGQAIAQGRALDVADTVGTAIGDSSALGVTRRVAVVYAAGAALGVAVAHGDASKVGHSGAGLAAGEAYAVAAGRRSPPLPDGPEYGVGGTGLVSPKSSGK